jgi:predicted enzyme related to lactoylglutathione lyase
VDATAAAVVEARGTLVEPPADAGPGGRLAVCEDPQGAPFRLWQARAREGAQVMDVPGAWSLSDLHAPDPAAARRFYRTVFGWEVDEHRGAGVFRLPGPDDVVAGFSPSDENARWWVRFAVADRDAAAARAEELGGRVLSSTDAAEARDAVVADPHGAVFQIREVVAVR